jgi:phage terminase small subunit
MKNSQSRGNEKTLWRAGKRGSTSHNLTARQKLFALEYLKDLNATEAAIRAGYSPRTAEAAGSRLLRNVKVLAEIQAAMDKRCEKLELTAKYTLRAITNIGHFDPRKLFDEKGNMKDIPDLDADTARIISGFDFVTLYDGDGDQKHAFGQLRKIRLRDSLKALDLEGRHQKLFTDKVEHGLDEETRRLAVRKLDFSGFSDRELVEVIRSLKAVGSGCSEQRGVQEEPTVLAPDPHKDPR